MVQSALLGRSGGMPPQKNFGVQAFWDHFWGRNSSGMDNPLPLAATASYPRYRSYANWLRAHSLCQAPAHKTITCTSGSILGDAFLKIIRIVIWHSNSATLACWISRFEGLAGQQRIRQWKSLKASLAKFYWLAYSKCLSAARLDLYTIH